MEKDNFKKQYEEESTKFPHIKIEDLYFYDEEKKGLVPAQIEFFGHCSFTITYNNGKTSKQVRSVSLEGVELEYNIISEDKDKITVDLGNSIYSMGKEKLNIIIKHYNKMNKKFIDERLLFKEDVDLAVQDLLNDVKLNSLINNYIQNVSPMYFIDFELIAGIEYELINTSKKGKLLLLTNENLRASLLETSEEKNGPTTTTYVNLKNNDAVQQYLKDNFQLLVKILIKNYKFTDDIFATYVCYKLLILQTIKYFSNEWKKRYGEYFLNISELSLEEVVTNYCSIDVVDPMNLLNAGMFIYFLMDNYKFDKSNENYIECYNITVDHISFAMENKKIFDFENKLTNYNNIKSFTIDDIDLMSGSEFEIFISLLFTKIGYSCQVTKASGDQGVDVIGIKNGKKIGVQAKCYSNKVTNTAIQEVTAGIKYYNCDKGMVVTNNYFTESAVELAQSNNIILWDRNMLKAKINEIFND